MSFSLALQPLTKFGAEGEERGSYIASSLLMSAIVFFFATVIVLVAKNAISSILDPTGNTNLSELMNYMPLLYLTAYYRNFAVSLLQTTYEVRKIFWIDATYFIGTLILILGANIIGKFSTAEDLVVLNIVGQGLSSSLAIPMTLKNFNRGVRFQRLTFVKMLHYGKYIFGGNSVYTLFTQTDIFFVSSFVGVVGVALYSAAKLFTRIFDVLGQVLQMFLIPYTSKESSKNAFDNMRITAEKAICFSTIILLPIFLSLFIFPKEILHMFYKGKYDEAASILRIFSLLAIITPWNGVAVSYLLGMGKAKQGFYIGLIFIIIALILYVTLTPPLGAVGTSLALVFSFIISTVIYVIYLHRFVPINIVNVVKRVKDIREFYKTRMKFIST
jgi:O-antigen/teichoic acid export membrane protein